MARFVLLCVGVLAVSLGSVRGLSEQEEEKLREVFLPILAECQSDLGISDDDLKAAKESKNVDGVNPCLFGCVGKKTEMIDDKGNFNLDLALEKGKKYLPEEDSYNKFAEIAKACASVNDEAVSDGDKGCERGTLLFKCMIKHKELAKAR